MNNAMTNTLHLLLYSCAIPATMFAVFYGLLAKWWRSHTGRALFTSSVALALVLYVTVVNRYHLEIFDHPKAWFWIQFLILFYTALALWYLLGVLGVTLYCRWRGVRSNVGYDEHGHHSQD